MSSSTFTTDKCIPLQTVGGDGGGSFNSYREDGSLISHLEVWADSNRLRGIKVYYSNSRTGYSSTDTGEMFGKAAGTKFEFTFEPGEIITSLSIWNTKWDGNTFVGAFKFITSLGKTFYPKESTSSHHEYTLEVGYGAMVGISGRSGNALDKLGFYLIRDAKQVDLSDIVYNNSSMPTPVENNLVDITYSNETDDEQTHQYEYSYTAYQENNWTSSSTFTQSYSLTISAEVPILEATAGAEASASWEYQQQTTNSMTYSYTQQVTATYPVVVSPHSKVELNMTYFSGHCKITYSGLVSLVLDNNQTFAYYATGTYAGGNTTNINVTLTTTPIDSSGQEVGESNVTSEVMV